MEVTNLSCQIRDPPAPARSQAETRASQSQGSQEWEFANPKFKRGQLQLLTQVKRKAGSTETTKPKTESIKRVLYVCVLVGMYIRMLIRYSA